MPPSLTLQAPVPANGHPWAQTVPGLSADKPPSVALPSLPRAERGEAGSRQGLQAQENPDSSL